MSVRPLVLALFGLVACTYQVNRSALAPHAAPTLHSGQPLDGAAEVALGAASVADVSKPTVGNDEASVEIPGTQVHGDARLRVNDAYAIGFMYESGLDATAHKP